MFIKLFSKKSIYFQALNRVLFLMLIYIDFIGRGGVE
nr:MAG TPA: hypothetical protein [Caudoviricetes sp.]